MSEPPHDAAYQVQRGLDAFEGAVAAQMESHLSRSAGFERRATTLLGTITAVLSFLFAVIGAGRVLAVDTDPSMWVRASITAAIGCLILSAVAAAMVFRSANVQVVADETLESLWRRFWNRKVDATELRGQLVQEWVVPRISAEDKADRSPEDLSVLESAKREANRRGSWVNKSVGLLAVGLVLIGVSVMSLVWSV